MRFRDNYYFLSNMFPCPISLTIEGRRYTFDNAEAAFQAQKCPARAHEFESIEGRDAKRLGHRVEMRPDWDSFRIEAMARVLEAKFRSNPELQAQLAQIEGPIVEDNTWNDTYWGRCNGRGENWLGKLLMQVRAFPPAKGHTAEDWRLHLGLLKTVPNDNDIPTD